ncbi:hypothetical protein [Streptomyces sp. NPDC001492]
MGLVREGGGGKGIAFVGALVAAGCTVPELEGTLRKRQFASFEDGWARHFGKPGAALALNEERLARKNVVTLCGVDPDSSRPPRSEPPAAAC